MSKYISELMSPQLMGVIYAFVGFIIALYVLSVVYVFIDARRRGASAYVAWGIIALIPFVGLIAYLVLRPHSYASDREEQELDMALRERQLAQYGTCPQCGPPSRRTLWSAPCATPRFATCAPAAIARSTRTGRSVPTAELASSNASIAGPVASHGHRAPHASRTRAPHPAPTR